MLQVEAQTMKAEIRINQESLEAKIEATQREFQTQLQDVGAERGRGTGIDAGKAKPPKFDEITSWPLFRRQFETVAAHNCWTRQEISTYLITALQGRAKDVLHRVPKGATYEETLEDQHLAAA
jgi:hypothetical protein